MNKNHSSKQNQALKTLILFVLIATLLVLVVFGGMLFGFVLEDEHCTDCSYISMHPLSIGGHIFVYL